MKIELKIVEVTNPDFEELVTELNAFFDQQWGDIAANYQEHHNLAKMKQAIAAYVDGKPVGCGCWKLLTEDSLTAEIKRMYVKEESRGLGIAAKLLQKLEESIAAEGYHEAVLETGADMLGTIKFYEKQGYRLIPNYGEFVNDEVCVCMKKEFSR